MDRKDLNLPSDAAENQTMAHPMIELERNKWYRAFHKGSARVLTVMYLGVTGSGMQFCDKERNTYSLADFYFWKRTE